MKVTKIHDLSLIKMVNFGQKHFFEFFHFWWFLIKKHGLYIAHENGQKWSILNQKSFSNFFNFDDFWSKSMAYSPRKWPKMVDFGPKKFFEFYVFSMRTCYTAQTPVISDVCNLLPYFLSHMDAESPNRQYKGSAYTIYISGSYRAV